MHLNFAPFAPVRFAHIAVLSVAALSASLARAQTTVTVTDSYTDASGINAGQSSGYRVTGGRLTSAVTGISVGTGTDGSCNVNSGTVSLSTSSCAGRATADAVASAVTGRLSDPRALL